MKRSTTPTSGPHTPSRPVSSAGEGAETKLQCVGTSHRLLPIKTTSPEYGRGWRGAGNWLTPVVRDLNYSISTQDTRSYRARFNFAGQANGACTVRYGNKTVLINARADKPLQLNGNLEQL